MTWDYIIVGAGSAGCAVAYELVRAGRKVLVLEAGGRDRSPFIRVAAGQVQACATHDWGYSSQPDPSRNGASEKWIRGRVLGGSSSINGTMWVRGTPADYNRWNVPGWSWEDVLPIFREYEGSDQRSPLRGQSGPLRVRTVRRPHRITKAFIDSACAAGYAFNPDYNGETQEGAGYAQLSQRRGFRCSAADAFLKPLLGSKNLRLLLNTVALKIEFEGRRAVAVHFRQGDRVRRECARDIIVCGGVINSPKLLMHSGIGDPEELIRHRIDTVIDLPGVGRNLKEQPLVRLTYRTKIPTYNLTEGPLQKLGIAAQFLLNGEGPISNLFEGAAFVRSSAEKVVPDLQIIFMPFGYDDGFKLAPYPSVMVLILESYPLSSGAIRLASANPDDSPLIECQLLKEREDAETLVRGIRTMRRVMRTAPIAGLIEDEVTPGRNIEDPAALHEYVRNHAGICLHPLGTCRMGTGADAVVGPDLRVRGSDNLWVADASVMPQHLSANLNAVCIMIGMKLGKQLASQDRARPSGSSATHQWM